MFSCTAHTTCHSRVDVAQQHQRLPLPQPSTLARWAKGFSALCVTLKKCQKFHVLQRTGSSTNTRSTKSSDITRRAEHKAKLEHRDNGKCFATSTHTLRCERGFPFSIHPSSLHCHRRYCLARRDKRVGKNICSKRTPSSLF